MKILGISAYYHDSAAALLVDGEIIAAAQEERFTRVKHDAVFPANAVKFCLEFAGLALSEIDIVVFYDKPLLKFERIIETFYDHAPRGLLTFVKSMPIWLKDKLFLRRLIWQELGKISKIDKSKTKLLFSEHHLSHAASAYYPSPFVDATILTIDGVGEWATASICHAHNNQITVLKELHFPHSLGLLYSSFTYFLGFKVNSGEYKLMGLAPYADRDSAEVSQFAILIKSHLVKIQDDGSISLDQRYYDYAVGDRMINPKMWEKLLGLAVRKPSEAITQTHADLALAIQIVTEEIVLKMAGAAKKLTGSSNLCLAGGVALNCVSNSEILKSGLFEHIWIQPAAGDAGGALGAALAAHYIYDTAHSRAKPGVDSMHGALLGPEYDDLYIAQSLEKYHAHYSIAPDTDALCAEIASHIANGKVVGWFQGRAEFGPRALGHRSILADPRDPAMQQKLNLKIKYREGFRPFAPSVTEEDTRVYFDINVPSPYMLYTAGVQTTWHKPTPPDITELSMTDRLSIVRSTLPAITHIDMSARLQTVNKTTQPLFHKLLKAFKAETGIAVLVNTSFNVRGEPPVLSPDDAYICLMETEMDILAIGSYILHKSKQPKWISAKKPKEAFNLD